MMLRLGLVAYWLYSTTVLGFISPEQYKGLDALTDEPELKPLQAMPWVEGGLLANHGEMLDPGDLLRELIELLFHRAGTFDPSTRIEVVRNLTPFMIGQLLASVQTGRPITATTVPQGGGLSRRINSLIKEHDSRLYKVLLSLLWHKAKSRSDFANYYWGLRYVKVELAEHPGSEWRKLKFDAEELRVSEPPDPAKDYDRYLAWVKKRINQAPPLEHQDYSFFRGVKFADCGSTSLRNVLKLALDHEGKYDLRVLQKLGAIPGLLSFFKNFNTRKSQQDQEARNAWAEVVSNRDNVEYRSCKRKCELDAGASNMLALMGAILPNLDTAQGWEHVFRQIEEARKSTRVLGNFNLEEDSLSRDLGDIRLTVEGLGAFTWHFQSDHFYIEAEKAESLGPYPGGRRLEDYAIFYPGAVRARPGELAGFVYEPLRTNEQIEAVLARIPKDFVTVRVALLNRLSTDDARVRVFPQVVTDLASLDALLKHKNFRVQNAYLMSLIKKKRKQNLTKYLSQHALGKYLSQHARFLAGLGVVLTGHTHGLTSAVFSPDGSKILTTATDQTARLWDAEGNPFKTMSHETGLSSAVFSPDGNRILTASDDGTVKLWDAAGRPLLTLVGHTGSILSAVFNPDSSRILTTSLDKTARLWDATTGRPMTLSHEAGRNSAVFGPDGNRILTGSDNGTVRLRDGAGKPLLTLVGHTGSIVGAVFSPDGSRILSASTDRTARLWDAATGRPVMTLSHEAKLRSAVFSPDGSRILTGSWDNSVRLWDAGTGKIVAALGGHTAWLASTVFSPDGSRILTASWDYTARLWSGDGKPLLTLVGHTGSIVGAVFSPDGSRILTASTDRTARLWDAKTGKPWIPEPLRVRRRH